ncbi:S-layer homology domain-containing protein [Paenibacillus sp. LjRoot153]|uniref:S-layer homology domain-containing protein n=1 Tax=Paenibacillus sp. LjRoot153 TaxID=3342270 RepID=UPI003ECFEE77
MIKSKNLQKSMAVFLALFMVISLFPTKPAFAADLPVKVVTIDSDAADTNPANTFKGYGVVSGNNTSRLLLDYKDEHPTQYWEIMNGLFNQDTGAGINDIKIEMGNDSNTSSGTEPATKRSDDESANVRRGAGFVFAADAKTINPNMKVSILRWTQPSWVQPWSDGNTDPTLPATLASYERMYKWYKDTAIAIQDTYGYLLDYINPDRNETSTPNVNFIKWFAKRMRADTTFPNYDKIKIVASDENTTLNIPTKMLADADLMNAVDVMAYHYNLATSPDYLKVNEENKKEVWYSEGVAPQTAAKYRANSDSVFGGVGSALDIAGRFIGMYTQGRRTHYMFQPAVSAFYSGAPYSSKEIISAKDPWSGYYTPDVGINTTMQFTQFAANNWMYIPNASAGVIGNRGNSEMDGNVTDAEYNRLTFVSPDKKDFSVVMVNDSDRVANYQFDVKKNISNAGKTLQVWETRGPDAGQAYDANWYQKLSDIAATDNGDVYSYTLTVKPHAMVSLTSTVTNPNTGHARTPYVRNNQIPAQSVLDVAGSNPAILYEDDFEYSNYPVVNGLSYLERRGGTPRYTADQGGAFEVYTGIGMNESNGLKQMIYSGNRPGTWATTPFSYTVLGDERWANYETSIDFKMDLDGTHTGENYVALGLRHTLNGTTSDSESGYKFRVYADGTWRLIRFTATVASGSMDNFDASAWHHISIKAAEKFITATIDGKILTSYTDNAGGAPLSGQVMIQSSVRQSIFDNLKVEAVNGYVPYATDRVDDLDSRVTYHEGSLPWGHSLSGGAGRINRTITTSGTTILPSNSTKIEGTPNRWYLVRNEGNTSAWSSNTSNAWAGETGSYASFTFSGTSIAVYGIQQGTSPVARMDVYLDDAPGYTNDVSKRVLQNFKFNNGSAEQQIYSVTGLAPGTHTIKIVKTAAASGAGNYISISKAVVSADNTSPTYLELPFTGTGFNLVGDTGSGTLDMYVDNTLVDSNVVIPAATINRSNTYSYRGLSNGSHTLKVVMKDGSISIDAIDIMGAIYGTVSKTALTSLISQVSSYIEEDYMPTEWTAFTNALTEAQVVLADAAASQYAIDSATTKLQTASDALRLKKQPVTVTGAYATVVATKVGEAVAGLPTSIKVTLADGTTNVDANINWVNNTASRFMAPYSTTSIKGEVVGGKNLFVNAQVEVIPSDLVYFIDPGVAGDVTPPFTAIKNLMGIGLLNDKADQPSTSDTVWGHTPTDANYKYKTITGAVVATDKSQTGVYGSDTKNNPLVYVLPLKAGKYTITSFHRDWWNNTSRTMDITLSYQDAGGLPVTKNVRSGLVAGPDGTSVSYDFNLPTDGTVKYTVNNTYTGNQAALISYLGVAKKIVNPADQQAVDAAKGIIDAGTFDVNKTIANTENDVKLWLSQTINGLAGLNVTGVTVGEITYVSFQAASGDTDGSFTFNVPLSKGNADATSVADGTIIALDSTKPVISLVGDAVVNLAIGSDYVDAGATALDDREGDITGNIVTTVTSNVYNGTSVNTSVAGTYTYHYNVSDAAGNAAAEVTRQVIVSENPDVIKPIITLNGDAIIYLANGAGYIDAGASAADDPDGDITGNIVTTVTSNVYSGVYSGTTVDTTLAGTYTYHYNVSDAAGNAAAEVTRTVVVADKEQTSTPDPETPSTPSTPETPQTPEDSTTPESTSTQILKDDDLSAAVAGTITAKLKDGKDTVLLPSHITDLVGNNSLQLVQKDFTIEFSKEALKNIHGAVTGTQADGAQISFSATVASKDIVTNLINNQAINGSARLATASDVYDFNLNMVTTDGTQIPVTTFKEPLVLSFKVNPNADPNLLGVYYIAADGTIQYVGGTLVNGVMTVKVTHFSQYAVLEFNKTFSDVSTTSWASGVIKKMAAKHIIDGVTETEFNPEGNVTRAQFAAMLARTLGLKAEAVSSTQFKDVNPGAWYAEAIAEVNEAGIVFGRSSDTFAPDDAITREEMAVMTVRAYEYVKGKKVSVTNTNSFSDHAQIQEWAQNAVSAAQAVGLIQGRSANQFAPQELMTRAESAQVISNLLN